MGLILNFCICSGLSVCNDCSVTSLLCYHALPLVEIGTFESGKKFWGAKPSGRLDFSRISSDNLKKSDNRTPSPFWKFGTDAPASAKINIQNLVLECFAKAWGQLQSCQHSRRKCGLRNMLTCLWFGSWHIPQAETSSVACRSGNNCLL